MEYQTHAKLINFLYGRAERGLFCIQLYGHCKELTPKGPPTHVEGSQIHVQVTRTSVQGTQTYFGGRRPTGNGGLGGGAPQLAENC